MGEMSLITLVVLLVRMRQVFTIRFGKTRRQWGGAGYATLPVFDEAAYLAANPGLEAGIREARISSPTEHYWRRGVTEGREGFFEGNPFVITQPGFGVGEGALASGGEGMNRGGLVRGYQEGGLG